MCKKVIVQTHWTKKMLKVKRASWSDGTASSSITCCDLCLEGNSEQKMHDKSCHQRSDQISRSVVSDSLRPHGRSMPGLPVHHQLPEFTQTHVHRVSDAIQPSHPLSSPSPPAPNPSQHQGLFKWVSSLHQVAKVLEFQLQHQSLQWTPRTVLL